MKLSYFSVFDQKGFVATTAWVERGNENKCSIKDMAFDSAKNIAIKVQGRVVDEDGKEVFHG